MQELGVFSLPILSALFDLSAVTAGVPSLCESVKWEFVICESDTSEFCNCVFFNWELENCMLVVFSEVTLSSTWLFWGIAGFLTCSFVSDSLTNEIFFSFTCPISSMVSLLSGFWNKKKYFLHALEFHYGQINRKVHKMITNEFCYWWQQLL